MAYNARYRVIWKDQLGRDKMLRIFEDGHEGAETLVRAESNPVALYWDPDQDTKYPIFKASSMDIRLMSSSRMYFKDLFTSDKFKFKVKYYIDDMINEWWVGYLQPDLYSEPYENKNYPVSFKAIDGLGYLENIDFLDEAGEYYTGRKSDLEIILICLNKLGLQSPLTTAIDIYETRMATGHHDEPLDQAYTDCEVFEDMNCAEVLRETLKPYGAIIYQQGAYWRIVRISKLKSTSYEARVFLYDGTYLGYTIYNHNLNLTNENASPANRNVLVMGHTTVEMIPAIKDLIITHDYGFKSNIIPGGNMLEEDFYWDDVDNVWRTSYWRDQDDTEDAPGEYVDQDTEQMCLVISAPPILGVYPSPSIKYKFHDDRPYLYFNEDLKFVISFEFRVRAIREDDPTYDFPVRLYAQIETGSYVLNGSGWVNQLEASGEDLYLFLGEYASNGPWQSISFEGNRVPSTDPLDIRLYQAIGSDGSHPGEEFEVLYKRVAVQLIGKEEPLASSVELKTIVDENNNYIPEDIEVLVADIPDFANNKLVYQNYKSLADGSPTKLWQVLGRPYQETLIIALARMITDQYYQPTIMYNGTVEDSHIEIGSLVKDNWENLQLMVQEIVRNEDSNQAQVKLIQMLNPPAESKTHSLRFK